MASGYQKIPFNDSTPTVTFLINADSNAAGIAWHGKLSLAQPLELDSRPGENVLLGYIKNLKLYAPEGVVLYLLANNSSEPEDNVREEILNTIEFVIEVAQGVPAFTAKLVLYGELAAPEAPIDYSFPEFETSSSPFTIRNIKDTFTIDSSWSYVVRFGEPGNPGQGVPTGGTTGQQLVKNSNTNYDTEWVDVPEPVIGLSSRNSVTISSSSIANGATDTSKSITLGKSNLILTIETNYPAWIRMYESAAARSADSTRAYGVDPLPGTGVMLDDSTYSDKLVLNLAPPQYVVNNDVSPNSAIYLSITNRSGSTHVITVKVTKLTLEI